MRTLRALGALLTYPGYELHQALPEIGELIMGSERLGTQEKGRLSALLTELSGSDPFDLEERYIELFDRSRSTSLYLFEHVHGDSRDRGPAMVDLKSIYERAGFRLVPSELPDYLPAMLEYLSFRPLEDARDMLGDCAHVLRAVGQKLVSRGSRYAAVFDALLAIAQDPGLDWSAAPAPAEPAPNVDEDWMDAPAFGPGSVAGAQAPCTAGARAHAAPGAQAACTASAQVPSIPGAQSHAAPATRPGEAPLQFMPRASR